MLKFICLIACFAAVVLNVKTVSAAYRYPTPTNPPRQTAPPRNEYLPPKTTTQPPNNGYLPPKPTNPPQPPPNTYLPPLTDSPTPAPPQIDEEHEHVHEPGMPFEFSYSVDDPETANTHNHQASSDGDVTRGEYRVLLPDGRTQIVRYTADWKNGYNAEVTYE